MNQMTDRLHTPNRSYYDADPLHFMFWLLAILVSLALAFLPGSCGSTQTEASATATPTTQAVYR